MPTKAKIIKNAKLQKIFTPQITIATALIIFCVIMAVVCLLNPGTKEVSVTSPVENMKPLDAITPKEHVVQKFTSDGDYTKFGLYYANFSNYIQGGNLYISIENSQGETTNFSYNIGGIFDNSFLYINYPLKKNETYTVTIHISDDAEGITFFTTTTNNYNAVLKINKQTVNSSIIMVFNNSVRDAFAMWYYIMAIALISCYIVLKIDKDAYVKKA